MSEKHCRKLELWKPWLREFVNAKLCLPYLDPLEFGTASEVYQKVILMNEKTFQQKYDLMHDALLQKELTEDRFKAFVKCLNMSDQNWIAEQLLCYGDDLDKREQKLEETKIIQTTAVLIRDAAEKADANIVSSKLLEIKVITEEEYQTVNAKVQHFGNIQAMHFLMSFLIRKNPDWIRHLTNIAREKNFVHLAEFCELFEHIFSDEKEEKKIDEYYVDENLQKDLEAMDLIEVKVNKDTVDEQNVNRGLRIYQLELAEQAVAGKNVIICAPTGSGKTHVASHTIKKHLERTPNGKVLFFVPKVPLAKQQCDSIQQFIGAEYRVNYLVGGMKHNPGIVALSSNVLVITPKLFATSMDKQDTTSLSQFTLIIFDECHHANKGDPYMEIMTQYHNQQLNGVDESLPQVIGLTATPGTGGTLDNESVQKYLKSLCANLDATGGIVTVKKHLDELHKFTPYAEEDSQSAHEVEEMKDTFTEMICNFINESVNLLIDYLSKQTFQSNICRPPLCKGSQRFKQWCDNLQDLLSLSQDVDYTRNVHAFRKYLDAFNTVLEVYFICQANDAIEILKNFGNDIQTNDEITKLEETLYRKYQEVLNQLTKCKHDLDCKNRNLEKIEKEIINTFSNNRESRCILSVKMRRYTNYLKKWLINDCESLKKFNLNPQIFTGTGNRRGSSQTSGLTRNQQEAVLEMFKSGESKLIVSTPEAINEGVHVELCNIIICYNYIKGEIGYQQMKGRVRQHGGKVVNLSSKKVSAEDILNQRKALIVDQNIDKLENERLNDPRKFLQQLRKLQNGLVSEFNAKRKNFSLKNRGNGTSTKVFLITCGGCPIIVCKTTDIFVVGGNTYYCTETEFHKKYHEELVKPGKNYPDIRCKKCGHKWGRKTKYKELVIFHLLCENFKFSNTDDPHTYILKSKWSKVDFKPKAMEYPDLCAFENKRLRC